MNRYSHTQKSVSHHVLAFIASLVLAMVSTIGAQDDERLIVPIQDSFSPKAVEGNNEFLLTVQSYHFNCGTQYSHKSVSVAANKITLTFLPTNDPAILCPTTQQSHGPQFKIDPLKAGTYNIFMAVLQPCMVQTPACNMAVVEQPLGQLVVRVPDNASENSFTLSPSNTKTNTEFQLQLLNSKYACNVAYSHLTVNISSSRIDLSFLPTAQPNIKCDPNQGPFGPTFKINALPAGEYPIYTSELVPCLVADPMACEIAITPQYVGFLKVEGNIESSIQFEINPKEVPAEKNFRLSLLSTDHSCATEYTHISAEVDMSGGIYLSYLPTENTGIACDPVDRPYGPTFELKGLKEGKYPVYVNKLASCMFSNPVCMVKMIPLNAGTLVVNSKGPTWQLNPATTETDKTFQLQILSSSYHNCGMAFENKSVDVDGLNIRLGFTSIETPVQCITNISPWGPVFDIPALKKGRYKVFATDIPDCVNSDPACTMAILEPEAIGTLTVDDNKVVLDDFNISPEQTAANQAFEISVSSHSISCNVVFSNQNVTADEDKIILQYDFVLTRKACPDVYQPYGTTFKVSALEPGNYSLFMKPATDCQIDSPGCFDAQKPIGKISVGTNWNILGIETIQQPASTLNIQRNKEPVTMKVPFMAGPIHAELLDITGKIRARASLVTETENYTLHLPAGTLPGLYLLSIHAIGYKPYTRLISLP